MNPITIIGYNCAKSLDDTLDELKETYVSMKFNTSEEFPKMFKITFVVEECCPECNGTGVETDVNGIVKDDVCPICQGLTTLS